MKSDDATTRLAFVGDESLVVQCAAAARAAGYPVVVVASRSEDVRRTAADDAFLTLDPADLPSFLAAEKVDVLFSIANEFVVPNAILEQVAVGVNFHDGPLPDYAGLAVTTWALFNGETMHAVTWHEMTAEVDTGDIVLTQWFEITPDETAFSLNARCYQEAIETFPRVLGLVTGQDRLFAHQPDRSGKWYGRYRRPIVFIDPSKSAAALQRAVRSVALGPRIRNRVGVARCVVENQVLVVDSSDVLPSAGEPVGTISITEQGMRIATVDGDLFASDVTDASGVRCPVARLAGDGPTRIPPLDAELVNALTRADEHLARHETFWTSRLARFESTQPSHLQATPTGGWYELQVEVPDDAAPADIVTGVAVWWCRTSGAARCWFDFSDDEIESTMRSLAPLVQRPIGELELDRQVDWTTATVTVADELANLAERGPFLRDLIMRTPWLRHRAVEPPLHVHIGTDGLSPDPSLTTLLQVVVSPSGGGLLLRLSESIDQTVARRCAEQLRTVLSSGRHQPSRRIDDLDLLGARERGLLHAPNRTALTFDRAETVDAAFRRQVGLTPDAPAVSCADASLSYAELEAAVDAMARRLRESGASPSNLVGIALDRDIDLLVAVLAVLTIGAAYVPLDPAYPQERLAFMVSDSGLSIVIADDHAAEIIAGTGVTMVRPIGGPAGGPPSTRPAHEADDLAYVIYTSGSTGRPKGVMLEHRNVVNFFAAMDEVIDHDPPGTWLAVTSLSFDISVLELLWTVTRGFHVVIQKHGITSPVVKAPAKDSDTRAQATSLSLFFFAAGDEVASGGYRLLRECAKFADVHGFEAIWLPERHFHAFGGAYPNPSVLGAAVAALTERVAIRAGSVVLPLHTSARVAEEWAVVDNLSAGRVGVSFAPGWQPNDFVLNPGGYRGAREDLPSRIEEVRALWRGEAVDMLGPDDQVVSVRTLPRPIQPELPVWLTSAGTTTTFEQAGRMGLNLLTHLLGQSIEQLTENIQVYRAAWRQAGHPGEGRITVMLHTFLDSDSARAKKLAEQPMKQYLGTATGLLKNLASAFPTFANSGASADEAFRSLTDTEMDELLTVATARYLDTSGLFGSLEDATAMALGLSRAGVDEIACLVDFGIDTDHVLNSLPLLADLEATLDRTPSEQADDDAPTDDGDESAESFADLVARHDVTHLQCTPSLAAMLIADPRDRDALSRIGHLMVGGEALPERLGGELRELVKGRFTNMYGPTETTIWSLVHEIDAPPLGPIPIGRPIGNTSIHILDAFGQPVPIGALGELHIGGEGVARGYLGRGELTSQRFVDRPGLGRLYATGDLARMRDDGVVEFAGRVDFQVKIRGHRIELGEIETQLDLHPSVERSVVVARGNAADTQLIAFVVPELGSDLDEQQLRRHVGSALPDVMVPAVIVPIPSLPLTPNGKVDRGALPTDIVRRAPVDPDEVVTPMDDFERLVADAWVEQLERPVGRTDNFFDLGGHSLLAVAVFRRLQEATGLGIALTDVFRYPTVTSFATHLRQLSERADGTGEAETASRTGSDRGALRRQMLERRRGSGSPSDRGTPR